MGKIHHQSSIRPQEAQKAKLSRSLRKLYLAIDKRSAHSSPDCLFTLRRGHEQ